MIPKGSIVRHNENNVTVSMSPQYFMDQPAFNMDDKNVIVAIAPSAKEIVTWVAWTTMAYRAPEMFLKAYTQKKVRFENGLFIVDFTKDSFGFLPPFKP